MLNAIGLENPGVDVFLKEKLPYLRKFDTAVIVNMFGYTLEDYVAVAERLDGAAGIAGIEVNISCPNVKAGGMAFGTDRQVDLRTALGRPQGDAAAAHREAFAERDRCDRLRKGRPGCRLRRAFPDQHAARHGHRRSVQEAAAGELHRRASRDRPSGPSPCAWSGRWRKRSSLPIIGMGGIMTGEDALEFMLAGASAVAVGTANFVNPRATLDVAEGIASLLREQGVDDVKDIIGKVIVRREDRIEPQKQDHHRRLRHPGRDHRARHAGSTSATSRPTWRTRSRTTS